ncbi:fimbrial protein [Aquitalea sp. ASV15]|uniref:fimbrial protein n=1 Tax=Aquitalea sp. ASV15 TaxID=2795104 RepID=UPI0018EACA85
MYKTIKMLLYLLAIFFTDFAYAACTTSAGPGKILTFTLSNYTPPSFNPTVAIGTVLYTQTLNVNGVGTVNCPGGVRKSVYQGVSTYGAYNATYNTYPTSIDGIGIRIGPAGSFWPVLPPDRGSNPTITYSAFNIPFALIKTGPITAGGTLSGEVAGIWVENYATQVVTINWAGAVVVQPVVPTCTPATSSMTVNFGSHSAASFAGIGSTTPPLPFNLTLNCGGGSAGSNTRVYITLTDLSNPSNISNTLSLSADSTAKGLGIQIQNNGKLISYGPDSTSAGNTGQWFAGSAMNGIFSIPLSANYIRTGSIAAGTANGKATFTLSYR